VVPSRAGPAVGYGVKEAKFEEGATSVGRASEGIKDRRWVVAVEEGATSEVVDNAVVSS
jgi:hypothetical protein